MATLISPGVSVTIENESFYATAGTGTVPLIVIATAENKFQPGSSTALASGTVKSNANKLYLVTSQRDALQTFGTPTYYTVAGTQQYDNELNEHGLFSLYDYLGIANSAYVIRADVDMKQLAPSTSEPVGSPNTGDYWFDIGNTTWGVFQSNGDVNSSYSWQSKTPTVISSKSNLEVMIQAKTMNPIANASGALISTTDNLVINGVQVALTVGDSITTVVSKINSVSALAAKGISATVFGTTSKFSPSGVEIGGKIYGDIYNIRIVCSDIDTVLTLTGTNSVILSDLGFIDYITATPEPTPRNMVLPKSSVGVDGDFAVDVVSVDSVDNKKKNTLWQKIPVTTTSGTLSWWFKVGTTNSDIPGYGWREATPRVITGTIPNPTFVPGESLLVGVAGGAPIPVVVGATDLDSLVSVMNITFSISSVNLVARKNTVGNNNYLQIWNFDGTDTWLKDTSGTPLGSAGISTSQTYFGSVTGTVADPAFTAPVTALSAVSVATPGINYEYQDLIDIDGGALSVGASSARVEVASITAVDVQLVDGGMDYQVGDVISISTTTTPVLVRVEGVLGTSISSISLIQAGQHAATAPINPVSGVAQSGIGTGATFNVAWGVATVAISDAGSYTSFPSSPANGISFTGVGVGVSFILTETFLSSDSFSIDFGNGANQTINISGTTLDDVVASINAAFPAFISAGLEVASKVIVGTSSYLKINNPNGTTFTLRDVSGTPLNNAGIPVGYVFGKSVVFKGYSPALTVPSSPAEVAQDNIWINTTSQNRGESFAVKQYMNGSWVKLNQTPNTATIPVYKDIASADAGFGSAKGSGSVFMMYNVDNNLLPLATHTLMVWNSTSAAWIPLEYTASTTEPAGPPTSGTYWYNTNLQVDILVSNGQSWQGYNNAYPATDPNGVILSSSKPTSQSDNTPLVDYDIWVDTSDVENYPKIYRYNASLSGWTLVDNTDHTSSAGIIFTDARATSDGLKDGSTLTSAMVKSNYVDSDAPSANLYPKGLMLFNTRFSTNNIKVWTPNYLPTATYPDRWVTVSGNREDGTPYMGHWAQRAIVVKALKATIMANQDARAEQADFNLLTCPGYTEALADLKSLNDDKKNISFIVGDTPARLPPDGTSVQNWATNAAGAVSDGPDGLVTADPYTGIYYPWALATNIDGSAVFVPPSVMALRTLAYNDQVAYPWFAPAGYTRGLVTGATSVGYLTSDNKYQFVQLSQGQRDVLYTNKINPVAYLPNRGLIVYGQKTLAPVPSAIDRINVARLVNYLNYQLDQLAKPFLFEQNDQQTRRAVTTTFTGFIGNLVGLRAIYDFAVVCDDTNNTAERIDRNELWIDIAIKPEKAVEFIYIPIRLLNTGDPLPGANRG